MKNSSSRCNTSSRISLLAALFAVGFLAGCVSKKAGMVPVESESIPPAGSISKRGYAALGPSFQGGSAPTGLSATVRSISASASVDEIWVVARSSDTTAPADDSSGSGALMAKIADEQIPMPLKHTDVHASISGYIGSVEVMQQFQNPYSIKIEAVYVFPLPHNAAVNEFLMTIGDRRIRGIIRERKEAEQIYAQAKSQGYVATLLTEERPNVFTQSVANIEPGKEIDVTIKYFHALEYVDGWYEFAFPMVVGPRFNPSGMTNGVGAASRGGAGASGQSTEVQYLKPGERSGHDIALQVDVDAGVAIEEFRCATHDVAHESASPNRLTVSLKASDSIPNRSFVLRYRVAGEKIKSDLLTHRDQGGNYFTLMLFPPKEVGTLTRQPLELVFVLDCSGSMDGRPVEQAKAAVTRGLRLLRPGDSFQIINFSMHASQLGPRPLEATPENVQRGLKYLRSLNGEGGTMMIAGIKAALDFPHDPERLRFVCFLTDGYIGNEEEILREIHQRLGASRIFSFGIGSEVNRYLIYHMAKTGRGAVAYLGSRDQAALVMDDFFERISHPGLTDLAIDWGGMQVSEVFPSALPDLFVGRPVIVTGRFEGSGNTTIRVSGKVAGERMEFVVPAVLNDATATHPELPTVWARMKIAALAEQSIYEPNSDLPEQIKHVALDYSLMSAFTAFVAVDSSRATEGSSSTTAPVAVPVPEGVKYETAKKTFSNLNP